MQEESRPKVLLVDDSIDVHRLLKARLKVSTATYAPLSWGTELVDLARSITAINWP